MGVESGGMGEASPAVEKSARDVPPRNYDISASFFLDTYDNFAFSTIFKIKWLKSEEKLNLWGRWVWVPMNPSLQTKLRGDAPVRGRYLQLRIEMPISTTTPIFWVY